MEIGQLLFKHPAAAGGVDCLVEQTVGFLNPVWEVPGNVKVLHGDNLIQSGELLRGDATTAHGGGQPLQPESDFKDIQQILMSDSHDHDAFSLAFYQVVLLQPPQCLTDGGSADMKLVREPELGENIPASINAGENVPFYLLIDCICQGDSYFSVGHGQSPPQQGKRPGANSWIFCSSS